MFKPSFISCSAPATAVSWPEPSHRADMVRDMEQRRLGATGLYVSRLALGTMTWGRDTDEDDASSQLKAFIEVGGTLIDTADVYVDGESERVVGRMLQG